MQRMVSWRLASFQKTQTLFQKLTTNFYAKQHLRFLFVQKTIF